MNIGILTSTSISEFRLATLQKILEDEEFSIKVAFVDTRKQSFKDKLLKNIKRGRGGYILIMALEKIFSKKGSSSSISTKEFCQKNKIDYIATYNPYNLKDIEKLKKYNLDVLLLVGGYGIIKEPLLSLAKEGILSYHHGDMRKYRGMPPAFWELYNNEKTMGVTLQKLSKELDAGWPIVEKSVEIYKNDTLETLEKRAREESVDMMYEALKKIKNKEPIKKLDKLGKVYTLPNLREWLIFKIKMMLRKSRG